METLGDQHVLDDGDIISLGCRQYKLIINTCLDETQVGEGFLSVEAPHLIFVVSLDEEHTQAKIQLGSKYFDLGEREHHYCLVTLARQRLTDARTGMDPSAQGWLECAQLAKMLGIDVQHVNIQIFRARNQLMRLLPARTQLASIVERRRGGIRLGAFAFDIVRGSQIEGCYKP